MVNWQKIVGFEMFEELCMHIADEEFQITLFDLYLSKGYAQDGIDTKAFDYKTGKLICIQCKHYENLSASDLKKAVEVFVEGKFIRSTHTFIIATTDDYNEKERDPIVIEYKTYFKNTYGVEFDLWDKNRLEKVIQKSAYISRKFFGLEAAEINFHPKTEYKFDIKSCEDYLDRSIESVIKTESAHIAKQFEEIYNITSIEVYVSNRLIRKKKLCIIGEPQDGKSTLLKEAAIRLYNNGQDLVPIYVEMKSLPIRDIEKSLNEFYPYWKSFPTRQLIIMLDGLDEVPSDDFNEFVKYIDAFNKRYTEICFIFTCRSIFFYRHKIDRDVPSFDYFKLNRLADEQIDAFVCRKLGERSVSFHNMLKEKNITHVYNKPLFIKHVIKKFIESPREMPDSTPAIIEDLIKQSFLSEENKQVDKKHKLFAKSELYRKSLEKLAFSLQLMNQNSFQEGVVQRLFEDEEIQLLERSGIVSHTGSYWSFTTSLFQEHLAGKMLMSFGIEQIKGFVLIGKSIRKIKTRWLQVILSGLAAIHKEDSKYADVIGMIKEDSIGFITLTDPSSINAEDRLDAIKQILDEFHSNHVYFLNSIGEQNVSYFIMDDPAIIKYMISRIKSDNYTCLRANALRILRYCKLKPEVKDQLLSIVRSELETGMCFGIRFFIEIFVVFSVGDKELVDLILGNSEITSDVRVRALMLELIRKLDLVDNYYYFGVDTYDYVIEEKRSGRSGWYENEVEIFVLDSGKSACLKALLRRACNEDWISYYQDRVYSEMSFIKRLVEKLIELFEVDQGIIVDAFRFYRIAVERADGGEFMGFGDFFTYIDRGFFALAMYSLNPGSMSWNLAPLVAIDSFQYLLALYECNLLDERVLKQLIQGVWRIEKVELAQELQELFDNATKSEADRRNEIEDIRRTRQFLLDKQENGIRSFQACDLFKKYVSGYHELEGDEVFGSVAYTSHLDIPEKRALASSFLTDFFLKMKDEGVCSIERALLWLDTDEHFDYFRVNEIIKYRNSYGKDASLEAIAKQFYYDNLPETDFIGAIFFVDGHVKYNNMHYIVYQLYEIYRFETDFAKLLDISWFDMNDFSLNEKECMVVRLFLEGENYERDQIRKWLVANLTKGIPFERSLLNHIKLCAELNILDVKDVILEALESGVLKEHKLNEGIEIYLRMFGDELSLYNVYQNNCDYNSPVFWYLVPVIGKYYPKMISLRLRECIFSDLTNENHKYGAALALLTLKDSSGLDYIVDYIKVNHKVARRAAFKDEFLFIDTDVVLHKLSEIICFVANRNSKATSSFESPADTIYDILMLLLQKSEDDYHKVVVFLNKYYDNIKDSFDNLVNFEWFMAYLLDSCRGLNYGRMEISEVKLLLAKVA